MIHLCVIFKCFNGKILATSASAGLAKNRSFSAVFRGVVQHITPCLWNASTNLYVDCISRTTNDAIYTLALKQHRCVLKGLMEKLKFRIFAKL